MACVKSVNFINFRAATNLPMPHLRAIAPLIRAKPSSAPSAPRGRRRQMSGRVAGVDSRPALCFRRGP
jgi:hypothetical protein